MSSINRVTLLGNVGTIQTRFTPTQVCVVNLTLATNEKTVDKVTKEVKYVAEWHRVVVFGKLADSIALLDKGTKLFVDGSLKTSKYKDKITGHERSSTQIFAHHVEVVDKKHSAYQKQHNTYDDEPVKNKYPTNEDDDNFGNIDLPY